MVGCRRGPLLVVASLLACSGRSAPEAVDLHSEVGAVDGGWDAALPAVDVNCAHCHDTSPLSAHHPGEGLSPRDHTGLYGDGLVRADAAFPTYKTIFAFAWPERGRHTEQDLAPGACAPCHPVADSGVGHGIRQYPLWSAGLAFAAGGKSCAAACHAWLPDEGVGAGFEAADGHTPVYEGAMRPDKLLAAADNAHSRLWKEGLRPEHAPTKIASFNPGCGGCHNVKSEAHGDIPTCLDCHKFSGALGEPYHTLAIGDIEMFSPQLAPAMSEQPACAWCHPSDDSPPILSNAACYNCHLSAHQVLDETGQPHFWHLSAPEVYDPALCGTPEYHWLPSDQVGQVVTWEETPLSNVPAGFIDQMLAGFGYTLLSPAPYGARTFFLRYGTQNKGQPVEATAVVGVPMGVDLSQPLPVVAYLHPTVGFSDHCSISADPLLGPGQPLVIASQGYIAVAADLLGLVGFGKPSPEGTLHPYLVAEPTAIAMLDAVRAALTAVAQDPSLPQGDPDRVVIWGASQGGHGAFMTELYAPHYAPEFTVVAIASAIGGTDMLMQGETALNSLSPTTGALAAALVALADWYGFDGEMATILTDEQPAYLASSLKDAMLAECAPGAILDQVDSIEDIFQPEFIAKGAAGQWDQLYPWGCYLAESSAGRTTLPRISDSPILAIYGELDSLVQPEVELATMKRLCSMGYRIEYHVCAGLEHVQAGTAAFIHMFSWTKDRLAGKPWPEEVICTDAPPMDCQAD